VLDPEFVLVAPGSAGVNVERRVLDGIAALPEHGGRQTSISAGVARFPADAGSADELLSAARAALDRARVAGSAGLQDASATSTDV
jgi:GGDEF domain-containing protein